MTIKSTLMALGVLGTLVLLSSDTAAATTDTSKVTKPAKQKMVTVKAGDTLTSIADKNKTTYVRLFNANKKFMNPDVIDVGDKIRIPSKKEKLKDRFAQIAATAPVYSNYAPATYSAYPAYSSYSTSTPVAYSASGNGGNTYYDGNCTWYAKDKRPDLPNMLGNGGQWSANAAAKGFKTGSAPRKGAVAEQAGHVAYVEKVNKNGTVTVSEMNYTGYGQVSKRTVSAKTFHYIY